MKDKTKELADSVGAVYPVLFMGRSDGVLFTETELETFVALVAAAERDKYEVGFKKLMRLHEIRESQPNKPCCLAEREAIAQMFDTAPELVPFARRGDGGCIMCGFSTSHAATAIRARGTT
jgi:hypothetical protein